MSCRHRRSTTSGCNIKHHTLLHENILQFLDGFPHDADPIGIMIGVISALSTFYLDARNVRIRIGRLQTRRLIAKMPTIAAFAYRHSLGRPYVYPADEPTYTGDFLRMMFKRMEEATNQIP